MRHLLSIHVATLLPILAACASEPPDSVEPDTPETIDAVAAGVAHVGPADSNSCVTVMEKLDHCNANNETYGVHGEVCFGTITSTSAYIRSISIIYTALDNPNGCFDGGVWHWWKSGGDDLWSGNNIGGHYCGIGVWTISHAIDRSVDHSGGFFVSGHVTTNGTASYYACGNADDFSFY
jgi:hypothetical protein